MGAATPRRLPMVLCPSTGDWLPEPQNPDLPGRKPTHSCPHSSCEQVGWRKGRQEKKKVTVIGRMHLLTMRSKVNKQIRLQEKTENIFYPHWGSLGNELRCCLQWRFSKVCERTTLSVLLNCPGGRSRHRCVQLAFHIREQLELVQFTEQHLI